MQRLVSLSLIPLLLGLLASADLVATKTPPALQPASSVALLYPDFDRASSLPVALDPFEVLPKARYRLAPLAPTLLQASPGAPGSGTLQISWQEGYTGRGTFSGFSVTLLPTNVTQALPIDARAATFSHQPAGSYSFSITALGQYQDATATSGPITLLPTPPPVVSHPTSSCAYLIEVNLSTQSLTASHCGSVYLSSPITSGMAALRTPTGNYSIFQKVHNTYFYSPWPKGSPYYYSPMFIAYGMEFAAGGYYLHTDPLEPAGAFGPNSQNGPYASHGCIHVPLSVMASLYSWAPYGTRVSIHY